MRAKERIWMFWRWFEDNKSILEELLKKEDAISLRNQIEPHLHVLSPNVGWEFGPGRESSYSFSITLNGKRSNIEEVEEIVRSSPNVKGWEFHAGRPPRRDAYRVQLMNRQGQEVEIDASNWRYSLVGFNNREFFDIAIVAPNLERLDELAKQQAATIVLQGILGELRFHRVIARIEFVDSSESEEWTEIRFLSEHISCLQQN